MSRYYFFLKKIGRDLRQMLEVKKHHDNVNFACGLLSVLHLLTLSGPYVTLVFYSD